MRDAEPSGAACFGRKCLSFAHAASEVRRLGGWQAALPTDILFQGDGVENCNMCNGTIIAPPNYQSPLLAQFYAFSSQHPTEVWNVRGAAKSIDDLSLDSLRFDRDAARLDYCAKVRNRAPKCKSGYVPEVLVNQSLDVNNGWRSFRREFSPPFFMPCSSARGEDAAVLRSFFTDFSTGQPITNGTFLEIGGVDGLRESNTWILELCLQWQGILVEGHPRYFDALVKRRPRSLNLNMAATDRDGIVNYTRQPWTGAGVSGRSGAGGNVSGRTMPVAGAPLGERLAQLSVHRLDFISIDVEGSELTVVNALDPRRLSCGVVLIEVRADGQREPIMRAMLRKGFRYVGQLNARGNAVNDVIDDCFVNITHLKVYAPRSRALHHGRDGANRVGHGRACWNNPGGTCAKHAQR